MYNNLLPKNLAFLRGKKGLNKSAMSAELGFPRTTWGSYEDGIVEPGIDKIFKLSEYFGFTPTEILTLDLSKGNLIKKELPPNNAIKSNLKGNGKGNLIDNNTRQYDLVQEPEARYYSTRLPHIVTVNEHGIDNILFVPVKAQAGYLIGYGDPEYIETLPSFHMPGLTNKSYRMFEVSGRSMSPTLVDGDKVICEWVEKIEDIRENRVYVVVHTEGVAIKRVVNRLKERNKLYLKSDTLTHRADYPIKEIDAADIREIWYVRLTVSPNLAEPAELYTRVNDMEVTMHEMRKTLEQISKSIKP